MRILLLVSLLFIGFSCNNDTQQHRPNSTGNPYEVFVIGTAEQWNGALGDTLRAVLGRDVNMLNQPEPELDLKFITKETLNNLINKHRNLIVLKISDTVKTTKISADYDIKSSPQVILYMSSPSEDSLANYIHANGEKIISFIDNTEQDRFVSKMIKHPAKDVNNKVKEMFGFDISIPKGYTVRNSVGNNFMWVSYELPLSSQGIVIYTYPYDSLQQFSADFIINMRNVFTSNIPGPRDSSFMTTSKAFEPELKTTKINGRTWIETKGFWDVEGDYMGGPFVSYTTIDKNNNRVVVIDTYVFSPKASKGKRNYMKQLEAVVRTVKFQPSSK